MSDKPKIALLVHEVEGEYVLTIVGSNKKDSVPTMLPILNKDRIDRLLTTLEEVLEEEERDRDGEEEKV